MKLGATNTFSEGKVSPDDEGDLNIAIGVDHPNQIVKVFFQKPVAWIGLGKAQATELANLILKKAEQLDH